MKILSHTPVFTTRWLRLFEVAYETVAGKAGKWLMVSREEKPTPHEAKLPDAVVAIGWFNDGSGEKLVVTSEFRIPLACRELGFVAGLIDKKDYAGDVPPAEAARRAAIREFKEETGLDFEPTSVSPPNLYSSAGMTNESVIIVEGRATGTPCKDHLEGVEDIEVDFVPPSEFADLRDAKGRFAGAALSQKIWCYLQGITVHFKHGQDSISVG